MSKRSPPLTFNVRIFDVKTDKEERKTQYRLSKVEVNLDDHRSFKSANEDYQQQKERVDKKIASIVDLLIWGLNNSKSIEFVNQTDDDQE